MYLRLARFYLPLWLFMTSMLFWEGLPLGVPFVFMSGFFLLFSLMVVEDHFYQTVDLRWAVLLLSWVLAGSAYHGDFSAATLSCGVALCYSWMCFIMSWRRVEPTAAAKPVYGPSLAFLPSLGAAVFLWLFILPLQFQLRCIELANTLAAILLSDWLLSTLFFLPFAAVTLYKLLRLLQLRKEPSAQIVYGFGGGDIWICAILGAQFGWQIFFPVLFGALLLHLVSLAFLYCYQRRT